MKHYVAVTIIVLSITFLEFARHDVIVTRFDVGQTPVARYALVDADGPVVVVAHGFAGSQQMMQGYALPLARAGYHVFVFDFLGHGRNPVPMSGDVTSVDGTTRLLVEQTAQVMDAVAPQGGKIALLGHSMATDILVRTAESRSDVGPIVLISAFSQVISEVAPDDLLLVTGAWESGLRSAALDSLRMVDPTASEGDIVDNGIISRRAVVARFSEHVSVLHSRDGRRAALDWLDRVYDRTSDITILPTGWAIIGLLAGLVIIFRPIARFIPLRDFDRLRLNRGQTAIILLVPATLAPLCALLPLPDVLPVLVADYLMLHLLVFGVLQLALLRVWRVTVGPLKWVAFGVLLLACAIFGFALDRYAANFWPTAGRAGIIAAMLIGALPFMVADAVLTTGQSVLGRLATRASFLVSLGIAVAFDFERLFFLLLIAPVMILFYIVFGTMGRVTALRAGPIASGLALGVVLAWALGVSFPMFQT